MAHQVAHRIARRSSWEDERGSNLVEFAIIVPVLLMLVFGAIDFGLAYNNSLALRAGAQEGVRAAAVGTFGGVSTCSLSGIPLGVTQDPTRQLMCLTKSRIGLPANSTSLRVSFVDPAGNPSTYDIGNYVRICARIPMQSATRLFSRLLDNRTQSVRAEMRIEQVANPPLLALGEPAVPVC